MDNSAHPWWTVTIKNPITGEWVHCSCWYLNPPNLRTFPEIKELIRNGVTPEINVEGWSGLEPAEAHIRFVLVFMAPAFLHALRENKSLPQPKQFVKRGPKPAAAKREVTTVRTIKDNKGNPVTVDTTVRLQKNKS